MRPRGFIIILLLAGMMAGEFPGFSSVRTKGDTTLFRMMVRLWPAHHTDPDLSKDLLDALDEYRFCDEVWLCGEMPATQALSFHEASAQSMAPMAEKLRKAGIIPSLQVAVLGHGDGAVVLGPDGSERDSTIHWGTMVGPNGEQTLTVNCPRQDAYLDYIGKSVVPYVLASRPYSLYLDDDLRMTQHPPAMQGCFCDTCISLFNRQHGYSFDRTTLVSALEANAEDGVLRRRWIAFGQESLAGVARAIAREVHRVSPETRVGLQHNYFHHNMLEGWDWIPILEAVKEETGHVAPVRPGELFYSDAAPRGMLRKGLEIAREIRRLPGDIVEIAPEIEGYQHKATGKSAGGICLETMYYLSMGATQMSYALICSAQEPMEWYASHYFKALSRLKPFAAEYAEFNLGTMPAGIDPYMSPDLCIRDARPGDAPWAWTYTSAGNTAFELAPLGLPFAPEDPCSNVLLLDAECAAGMREEALALLLTQKNIVMDTHTWDMLSHQGLMSQYQCMSQDGESIIRWETSKGRKIAVVPIFSADINGKEQTALAQAFDWASGRKLPALLESVAQVALVPRTDAQGRLRSVSLLSCSLSEEEHLHLRLRPGCLEGEKLPKRFTWKRPGHKDVRLKSVVEGKDVLVDIPELGAWEFGWIAVE